MFRRRRPKPAKSWTRVGIFVFGVLTAYTGIALLQRGVFMYHNHYRAEVYSPGVIVMGLIFMVVALIPDSLVEFLIRRARR